MVLLEAGDITGGAAGVAEGGMARRVRVPIGPAGTTAEEADAFGGGGTEESSVRAPIGAAGRGECCGDCCGNCNSTKVPH
jgi:hypothetical protein